MITPEEKKTLVEELVKGLVPVVRDVILEELKQSQNGNDIKKSGDSEEKIDYAAIVKDALK